MEGRERALKAYDININERKCYNCCCGLNLTATRLLGTDDIEVEEPMDPQILNWEHVGITKW